MQAWRIWIGVLVCCCGFAADEAGWRGVALDSSAWHLERSEIGVEDEGVVLRSNTANDGLAMVKRQAFRQESAVEADIRMERRLNKRGWSLAGVTLYQDLNNYWMLALVEGPNGSRSIDFIEKRESIWQAQSQGETALKREGSISFAWKPEERYRLRLAVDDVRIRATVFSVKTGSVLGSASYLFEKRPAVRGGWPGLIVRESEASLTRVSLRHSDRSAQEPQTARVSGPLGRVALLDDDLPGHDRQANARLAASLTKAGFGVNRLSCDQMLAPHGLSGDLFRLVVIPQCDSVPLPMNAVIQTAIREGVSVIFLGGPFLDRELCKVNGQWLDHAGQEALLQKAKVVHRSFEIGPEFETTLWRRACQDGSTHGKLRVVKEGPGGISALRYDTDNLVGWDVWHSPDIKSLFGEGDRLFCFDAKGDGHTSQLAVEITERDGSRWIATASLTARWQRVILRNQDFHFWGDSPVGNQRGGAADHLNPRDALRVGFGLSASHTPAVGGGNHTLWLAGIGSAPDPLEEIAVSQVGKDQPIECVTPRYKVYSLSGPVDISDVIADKSADRPFLSASKNLVCAIPRTLGEGFNRKNPWRFIPCAQVASAGTGQQVCEWLLTYNRFPLAGRAVAGFGYRDPAVWSLPEVVTRITAMAVRMTKGVLFEEAGCEQFAYWPDERVSLGARVRAFDSSVKSASVVVDVRRGDKSVFNWKSEVSLAEGDGKVSVEWQPPRAAASYDVRVSLMVNGEVRDVIRHEFAVLDPRPAPKADFITVVGGDFILGKEKWYPVGMNYWPLYVSGMEVQDYNAGWLKDAYYSPALVECDLRHMADMGINMVSIQTPPVEQSRNLLDFLRRCQKHGMHANLYLGQASPMAFREKEVKQYLETARLPGNATVFAYDTIWEPGNHLFKDDKARTRWDAEWRAWIDEQYTSVEQAEKSWGSQARRNPAGVVISPQDKWFRQDGEWRRQMAAYRRFMDNATSRLWGDANRRLRAMDPNHLVSFRQGNTLPYDFALSGPVKHIDFICPEGYAISNTDQGEAAIGFITRYTAFTTGGKPIVWSEFGKSVWDSKSMTWSAAAVEIQGSYSERFYRTALEAGANGTVPWWWPGGYRVNEQSDFGIIAPDGTERPAAKLIRIYAPRFKQPRDKQQPDEWLVYDRDAHAGGYCWTAFHEGGDAYQRARKQGKLLGIRTKGTGMSSVDVPLMAVGNVSCNGMNPPRYLDAEFNWFQVRGADGLWRDVKDGDEFKCVRGGSLQAKVSLGNVQQALWVPPNGTGGAAGGVALVIRSEGKIVGQIALKQKVAYLEDADFGEWVLLSDVQRSAKFVVRLEALDRTPFGESRVFSLKVE